MLRKVVLTVALWACAGAVFANQYGYIGSATAPDAGFGREFTVTLNGMFVYPDSTQIYVQGMSPSSFSVISRAGNAIICKITVPRPTNPGNNFPLIFTATCFDQGVDGVGFIALAWDHPNVTDYTPKDVVAGTGPWTLQPVGSNLEWISAIHVGDRVLAPSFSTTPSVNVPDLPAGQYPLKYEHDGNLYAFPGTGMLTVNPAPGSPVINSIYPNPASPGGDVVLTGTDLDVGKVDKITIDSQDITSFTNQTATSITFTVPAAVSKGEHAVILSNSGVEKYRKSHTFLGATEIIVDTKSFNGYALEETKLLLSGRGLRNVTGIAIQGRGEPVDKRLISETLMEITMPQLPVGIYTVDVNPGESFTYTVVAQPTAVNHITPRQVRKDAGESVKLLGKVLDKIEKVRLTGAPGTAEIDRSQLRFTSDFTEVSFTAPDLPLGTYSVVWDETGGGGGTVSQSIEVVSSTVPTIRGIDPPTITAGDTTLVRVNGDDLDTVDSVSFGTAAINRADFVSSGADHISVNLTIPAAGKYEVALYVAGGKVNTLANGITVNAPGVPTITGVSPASSYAGLTTRVTVSGNHLDRVDAFQFGGVTVNRSDFISSSSSSAVMELSLDTLGSNDVVALRSGTPVYTLAGGYSIAGERPDPTNDPDVRGILNAQAASAERYYRAQSGNISSRLASLRGGGDRGNRSNSFNLSLSVPESTRRHRDDDDRRDSGGTIRLGDLARTKGDTALASVPPACVANRWSFWSEGSISFGSLDEDGEVKLDHTTLGLTIGADYAFGDRLVTGVAVGYSRDKTDVGSHGSEVDGDGYTAALYGSYLVRPNVYLEAMVGYTAIDLDTERYTEMGFVKGNRDGDQYFASLALGYEYCKNGLILSPFARVETAFTRLDRYHERGNFMALKYGKQDIEMYTGSLGLNVSKSFLAGTVELTPSAGAEYAYNFKDDSRVALGYADTPGMPYSFSATSVARNTVTATAGVEARFNRNFSLGLKYRGSFASRRDNHNISLQGVWSW